MLFSELYGAYYNCMADILRIALDHAPSREEIQTVIASRGFAESGIEIARALREEDYKLIRKDGTTPIRKDPQMPLTDLQKRWLKAITLDPRFTLFGETIEGLEDVPPLFRPEDIDVFDKYADGDPYEDPGYRRSFSMVLQAIREGKTLDITTVSGKGHLSRILFRPDFIEYSEKDDKFRAVGIQHRKGPRTVNIQRIRSVSFSDMVIKGPVQKYKSEREVVFELLDIRNALERVMLHFAHFEKETEHISRKMYRVRLRYDKDDETELLIRILSFGPMIRVTEPEDFVALIKDRIRRQNSLLGGK